MPNDGSNLEQFVASVEQRVNTIEGWSVETNKKLYDDNGKQIVEFDVILTGRAGTGTFTWLIECRDRPSKGAAPGAWLEQLYGRRDKFGFSKVTAVSTTGFTDDVRKYAADRHIELRELRKLDDIDVQTWLRIARGTVVRYERELLTGAVDLDDATPAEVAKAVAATLAATGHASKVFALEGRGRRLSLDEMFNVIVRANLQIYEGVERNGGKKHVQLGVDVPADDGLLVETESGDARVRRINLSAEVWIVETEAPLLSAYEYSSGPAGERIARIEEHGPYKLGNGLAALTFDRVEGSDLMRVSFRMLAQEEE